KEMTSQRRDRSALVVLPHLGVNVYDSPALTGDSRPRETLNRPSAAQIVDVDVDRFRKGGNSRLPDPSRDRRRFQKRPNNAAMQCGQDWISDQTFREGHLQDDTIVLHPPADAEMHAIRTPRQN